MGWAFAQTEYTQYAYILSSKVWYIVHVCSTPILLYHIYMHTSSYVYYRYLHSYPGYVCPRVQVYKFLLQLDYIDSQY